MKVFKDPIHGSISLPKHCVDVIDTPEFQRLRNIKQLTAETVYPGATHNRFAHCIGVCYLAGKVIEHLRNKQKELKITEEEVKYVQLAGLCHDLGHGPLSHKFEAVVNRLLPKGKKWEHEEASVLMVHHLNRENKKIGLTQVEVDFISDLISGKPPKDEVVRYKRYQERRFLFQIVANKDNGIDVDKWDYFARDSHYLGLSNSFDLERIIPFMRVCECVREGVTTEEICYRDKLVLDLDAMFAVRWDLHYRAYQHRVVKLTESMYGDALYEYFTVDAKKTSPEFGRMEDVIKDMSIYRQIDDQIFGTIARSKDNKAQDIIERIRKRELYECIGEFMDADSKNVPGDDDIQSKLKNIESLQPYCSEDNLLIINHKYDYGMKEKNPLKHIFFYTKDNNKKGILLEDEKMPPTLPAKIQLRDVRLYTRIPVPEEELPGIKETVSKTILPPVPEKQLTGIEGTGLETIVPDGTPNKSPSPPPSDASNAPSRPEKSKGKRSPISQDEAAGKKRKLDL
ncbi:deoxynucleoside triphosphate triphosphohydrolase SAMHD1-like isoform X2 [Amphiura filiformis]